MIEPKHLAVFTIPFNARHDFTFRIGNLPARSFSIEISRAFNKDIPRTS